MLRQRRLSQHMRPAEIGRVGLPNFYDPASEHVETYSTISATAAWGLLILRRFAYHTAPARGRLCNGRVGPRLLRHVVFIASNGRAGPTNSATILCTCARPRCCCNGRAGPRILQLERESWREHRRCSYNGCVGPTNSATRPREADDRPRGAYGFHDRR